MRWLGALPRRMVGLFVDDRGFALAILVWLVGVGPLLPRLAVPVGWHGPLLFIGLAVILFRSCLGAITRHRSLAPGQR